MAAFALAGGFAVLPAAGAKPPRGFSPDEAIVAAHAAFRAGDALKLARHSAGMQDHILEPYLEYWRLKLRLEDMPPRKWAFPRASRTVISLTRLRAEWLKEPGNGATGRASKSSARRRERGC